MGRGSCNLGSFTSGSLTSVLRWITKKNHLMFPEGRGERNNFEIYNILFLTRPVLNKNFYLSLTCWSLSEPKLLEERKYLTPAPSSHPVPPKDWWWGMGRGNEKQRWSSQSRSTDLPKDWYHVKGQSSLPLPPTPYHYITKGLFTSVLLPSTSHPPFNKKLQGMLKDLKQKEKHSLKRLNKHQSQSEMAGMLE